MFWDTTEMASKSAADVCREVAHEEEELLQITAQVISG